MKKSILFAFVLLLVACEKTPLSIEDSLVKSLWLYENDDLSSGDIFKSNSFYKCMLNFKSETDCDIYEYIFIDRGNELHNVIEKNKIECTFYVANDSIVNLVPNNSNVSTSYYLGRNPLYSPNSLLYTTSLIVYRSTNINNKNYKSPSIFKRINKPDPLFEGM